MTRKNATQKAAGRKNALVLGSDEAASSSSGQKSSAQASSTAKKLPAGEIKRIPAKEDSHRNASRVRIMPDAVPAANPEPLQSEYYDQTSFHESQDQTTISNARGSGTKPEYFILRPHELAGNDGLKVLTNHFKVTIPQDKVLYEYSIGNIPQNATRPKCRMLILDMMEIDEWLYANRELVATDYRSKIISCVPLFGKGPTPQQVRSIIVNDFRTGTREAPGQIALDVTFTTKYELNGLQDFVEGRNEGYQEKGAKEALNIIIAKAVTDASGHDSDTFVLGSNRFYFRPGWETIQQTSEESRGLVATRGYYSTIKPGMNGLLLNVNNVCSAFYRAQRLDRYLEDYAKMLPDQKERLETHLRGLRVAVNFDRSKAAGQNEDLNMNARRYKTLAAFGEKPGRQHFKLSDKEPKKNVWDHLMSKYREATEDSDQELPCANVGGKQEGKQKFYLATQLDVLADQPYRRLLPADATDKMIRAAKKTPAVNCTAILQEGMRCLQLHDDSVRPHLLQTLGLQVTSSMLSIPARSIEVPKISYQGPQSIDAKNGKWQFPPNEQFFDTTAKYGPSSIVQFFRVRDGYAHQDNLDDYAREFVQYSENHGPGKLNFAESGPAYITIQRWASNSIKEQLKKEQAKTKFDLAVLVLPRANVVNRERYNSFKIAVDQLLGYKSICMSEKAIAYNSGRWPRQNYFANVFMKLNVRCGNANHVVEPSDLPLIGSTADTIILGADVTHPSAGSRDGTPSIAALVGSLDGGYARFSGSMRLNTGRQEIIDEMKSMARERFEAWQAENGKLPSNILFYRDGVGESQYAAVRTRELNAIKKAWKELKAKCTETEVDQPKLTVVVVTKRHNTRLYPMANAETTASQNCMPGTVVETGITSPYYFDFYLLSHDVPGKSGTAKPSHYFVLDNDMGFSAKDLQDLTLKLCFMYCKSTTSVSYVPAAYYADRLCEHGRIYLSEFAGVVENLNAPTKEVVSAKAKDIFYRGRGEESIGLPANPWNSNLDGTMFWM